MSDSKARMLAEIARLKTEDYEKSYAISKLLGHLLDITEHLRSYSDEIARDLPDMPSIPAKYWKYLL